MKNYLKVLMGIVLITTSCEKESVMETAPEESNLTQSITETLKGSKKSKIEVCHFSEEGEWSIIKINLNAWEAHSRHNDVRLDDVDGDGFVPNNECEFGEMGDCDDDNENIYPDAEEICDGIDNDCDGEIDEGVGDTYYLDLDGDDYGVDDELTNLLSCTDPGDEYSLEAGDCDDDNENIYPGAEEVCDGIDNDCDGDTDEGFDQTIYYLDSDEDDYGVDDEVTNVVSCSNPGADYSIKAGDCNDDDSSIHPEATEITDGKDNNCDGQVDETDTIKYYQDLDEDTYGNNDITIISATVPDGKYVTRGGDCNDDNSDINPGATEIFNNYVDENCDGYQGWKSSGGGIRLSR